jgi:predicted nucleotidyltransferase
MRAKAKLPWIAQRLREEGATRVVLFGSLPGGWFGEASDIDLAVEGLTERELGALEREFSATGFAVELVGLSDAPPALRERIETSGVELR